MSGLENAINSLMGRLEHVTNRLEKIEKQLASGPAPASSASQPASHVSCNLFLLDLVNHDISNFFHNFYSIEN
jgi:hypothetical protein